MNIGPHRLENEPSWAYRFRYAKFCGLIAIAFSLLLVLLFWVKLDPRTSTNPGLILFLYFGIPLGLGMCVLAGLGFFIGGIWALVLNEGKRAKARVLIGAAVVCPVSLFAFYWATMGLVTDTTLFAWLRGPLYVHRAEMPLQYWYSEAFWFWSSFYFPHSMYGAIKRTFGSNLTLNADAPRTERRTG